MADTFHHGASRVRQRRLTGFYRALGASVGVHFAVLVLLFVFNHYSPFKRAPTQNVLITKLVRLGKVRPKELLPRLEEKVEAPPPPAPTVVPPPQAPAVPKAISDAKNRVQEMKQVSSALSRLKKKMSDDGQPDGSVSGEVSDVSLAIMGQKFASEIYQCMKSHFDVLGLEARKLVGASATVIVKVRPDGKITDFKVGHASGVAGLDAAVERAVKKCGKVSAPPAQLRDQLKTEGIEIVFEP